MNRKLIFALQIVLVALAGAVIMSNSRGAGAALPISGPGFYAHVRSGQEAPQAPVGTGFTYQGSLKNGGNPANGQFDFQFKLYDALSGGGQVGSTLTVGNQTVTGGLFTVQLDFGAAAF
ncbi:MAG TPA: hypothetical protein VFR15_05785, partial [Chloroflexia bacterium]|nr:hypothetical protein [Chloroflexia bacterium]